MPRLNVSYHNRNIPDECHDKMKALHAAGHKLVCVAFPPQGANSWSVITDKTFFNRNIPDECHDKMKALRAAGHKPRWVAFPHPGGNCWSVIANSSFFNRNVATGCHRTMRAMTGCGMVRCGSSPSRRPGGTACSHAPTPSTLPTRRCPRTVGRSR